MAAFRNNTLSVFLCLLAIIYVTHAWRKENLYISICGRYSVVSGRGRQNEKHDREVRRILREERTRIKCGKDENNKIKLVENTAHKPLRLSVRK